MAAGRAVVGVTGSSGDLHQDLLAQVLAEYGRTIAPRLVQQRTGTQHRGRRDRGTASGQRIKVGTSPTCAVSPHPLSESCSTSAPRIWSRFGGRAKSRPSWSKRSVQTAGLYSRGRPQGGSHGVNDAGTDRRWSTRQARGRELCVLGVHLVADGAAILVHSSCRRARIGSGVDAATGEHVANALATRLRRCLYSTVLVWLCERRQPPDPGGDGTDRACRRPRGLNDAYNANPIPVAFWRTVRMKPGGRLVAVLGDMLELGPDAPAEHRRVGALAADAGVDLMYATGELGGEILSGFTDLGGKGSWFPSKPELAARLVGDVQPADVVVLKASRGLGFETIADTLLAHDEGADR